jgi:hypothetical protein
MSIVGPWGRRLVRALSCISMIVVLVLILARVFRPDGGLDIDEIEQAEVSVLTELLEQRFLDSKSVDISRGGSKVSSRSLQLVVFRCSMESAASAKAQKLNTENTSM